jgi:hypothetical protein
MSGSARLTPVEAECYKMWLRVSNYNIKPWEWNGGHIYHEDLVALDTFAEYESERNKREAAKHGGSSQWKRVG